MLLPQINDPQQLKSLSVEELTTLAEEIRRFLIEKLTATGGHLGSNLGWWSSRWPYIIATTVLVTK